MLGIVEWVHANPALSSERHSLTVEGMTHRSMSYHRGDMHSQGVFQPDPVIYVYLLMSQTPTLLLSCGSYVLPMTIDRTHPLLPLLGTESHHLGSLT